MATKIRMEFMTEAFRDILLDARTRALVEENAQRLADAAGPGYTADSFPGGFYLGRWIGVVAADTPEAMRDNAQNGTLEALL